MLRKIILFILLGVISSSVVSAQIYPDVTTRKFEVNISTPGSIRTISETTGFVHSFVDNYNYYQVNRSGLPSSYETLGSGESFPNSVTYHTGALHSPFGYKIDYVDSTSANISPISSYAAQEVDAVFGIGIGPSISPQTNISGLCYENNSFYILSNFARAVPCAELGNQVKYYKLDTPAGSGEIPYFQIQVSPGSSFGAYDVNGAGTVVGCAAKYNDGTNTAWHLEAFIAKDGGEAVELPSLANTATEHSCAVHVSDSGIVVGYSGTKAVYWDTNGQVNLLYDGSATPSMQAAATYVDPTGNIYVNTDYRDTSVNGEAFIYKPGDYTTSVPVTSLLADQYQQKFVSNNLDGLSQNAVITHVTGVSITGDLAARALLRGQESSTVPVSLRLLPEDYKKRIKNNIRYRDDIDPNLQATEEYAGDFVTWDTVFQIWYAKTLHFDGSTSTPIPANTTISRQFGLPGDIPIFNSDMDGDTFMDMTVWRPSTGTWYTCSSSTGYSCSLHFQSTRFGLPGDIPLSADLDQDGKSDRIVFRPLLAFAGIIGQWYYQASGSEDQSISFRWGLPGDIPFASATLLGASTPGAAVFRPSNGTWYIRSLSGESIITRQFGADGDQPMLADVTGDGSDDLVLYRPGNGTWYFCDPKDGTNCFRDGTFEPKILPLQWGLSSDIPVVTGYTGGPVFTPTIYRNVDGSSVRQSFWYRRGPDLPPVSTQTSWGLSNHIPSGLPLRIKLSLLEYSINGR